MTATRSDSHSEQGGIHWVRGGMQQALEAARAQSKPLFVYWGAVWCPPCNVIKATLFPDPRVIKATGAYVSVYLDGDTEEAQSWGERLNASGYPTLMVLDSTGEEVSRLSTGIEAGEFAETLERLSRDLLPIGKIVERALAAPAVSAEDLRLITGYSWAQRAHLEKDPLRTPSVFERLEAKAPADLAIERSRLHFLALETRLEQDEAAGKKGWEKSFRERESAWLHTILANPALVRANLQSLAHGAVDLVSWLHPEPGEVRAKFIGGYLAAMDTARSDKSLSAYERLITDYPATRLASIKDGVPLPEPARAAIRDRVMAAIESARDEKEHSFVLNSGTYILRKAGYAKEAWDTLKDHLGKAKAPYYVMSLLAEFAEEDGDLEGALEWAGKAYRSSLGTSTRLQWGTSYLSTLFKAKPKDKAAILAEIERFYEEHLLAADAFLGRSKTRMNRLAREAGEWATRSTAASELKALSSRLRVRCDSDKVPASESFRASCRRYFDGLGGRRI